MVLGTLEDNRGLRQHDTIVALEMENELAVRGVKLHTNAIQG